MDHQAQSLRDNGAAFQASLPFGVFKHAIICACGSSTIMIDHQPEKPEKHLDILLQKTGEVRHPGVSGFDRHTKTFPGTIKSMSSETQCGGDAVVSWLLHGCSYREKHSAAIRRCAFA